MRRGFIGRNTRRSIFPCATPVGPQPDLLSCSEWQSLVHLELVRLAASRAVKPHAEQPDHRERVCIGAEIGFDFIPRIRTAEPKRFERLRQRLSPDGDTAGGTLRAFIPDANANANDGTVFEADE